MPQSFFSANALSGNYVIRIKYECRALVLYFYALCMVEGKNLQLTGGNMSPPWGKK